MNHVCSKNIYEMHKKVAKTLYINDSYLLTKRRILNFKIKAKQKY